MQSPLLDDLTTQAGVMAAFGNSIELGVIDAAMGSRVMLKCMRRAHAAYVKMTTPEQLGSIAITSPLGQKEGFRELLKSIQQQMVVFATTYNRYGLSEEDAFLDIRSDLNQVRSFLNGSTIDTDGGPAAPDILAFLESGADTSLVSAADESATVLSQFFDLFNMDIADPENRFVFVADDQMGDGSDTSEEGSDTGAVSMGEDSTPDIDDLEAEGMLIIDEDILNASQGSSIGVVGAVEGRKKSGDQDDAQFAADLEPVGSQATKKARREPFILLRIDGVADRGVKRSITNIRGETPRSLFQRTDEVVVKIDNKPVDRLDEPFEVLLDGVEKAIVTVKPLIHLVFPRTDDKFKDGSVVSDVYAVTWRVVGPKAGQDPIVEVLPDATFDYDGTNERMAAFGAIDESRNRLRELLSRGTHSFYIEPQTTGLRADAEEQGGMPRPKEGDTRLFLASTARPTKNEPPVPEGQTRVPWQDVMRTLKQDGGILGVEKGTIAPTARRVWLLPAGGTYEFFPARKSGEAVRAVQIDDYGYDLDDDWLVGDDEVVFEESAPEADTSLSYVGPDNVLANAFDEELKKFKKTPEYASLREDGVGNVEHRAIREARRIVRGRVATNKGRIEALAFWGSFLYGQMFEAQKYDDSDDANMEDGDGDLGTDFTVNELNIGVSEQTQRTQGRTELAYLILNGVEFDDDPGAEFTDDVYDISDERWEKAFSKARFLRNLKVATEGKPGDAFAAAKPALFKRNDVIGTLEELDEMVERIRKSREEKVVDDTPKTILLPMPPRTYM